MSAISHQADQIQSGTLSFHQDFIWCGGTESSLVFLSWVQAGNWMLRVLKLWRIAQGGDQVRTWSGNYSPPDMLVTRLHQTLHSSELHILSSSRHPPSPPCEWADQPPGWCQLGKKKWVMRSQILFMFLADWGWLLHFSWSVRDLALIILKTLKIMKYCQNLHLNYSIPLNIWRCDARGWSQ